ncbi:MAG: DUF3137 domain-containing protein [Alphaproteobacteria bacterium]|nr:DUF3137 domain-containing protein [Alphaproteobacteria bacterium]MBR3914019.1 DUF3137 domain-containing protein [Alphaproteobacteria bacterium]
MQDSFYDKQYFLSHIKTTVLPILEKLENKRLFYLYLSKKIKKLSFFLILILAIFSFILTEKYNNGIFILLAPILGSAPYFLYKLKIRQFLNKICAETLPLIFNFLENAKVTPPAISNKMIIDSCLLSDVDFLNSSICFSFKYNGINCFIQKSRVINNIGRKYAIFFPKYAVSLRMAFKGIFVCFEPTNKITGHTIAFNQKNIVSKIPIHLSKIDLGDIYYDTYFQIFSTPLLPSEKEYIKSVLIGIKTLKNIFNAPRTDVSFFDNKILLALYTDFDMFSFLNLNHSFLDERLFLKVYENITGLLKSISLDK